MAAGSGNRFDSDIPKQFNKIRDKTVTGYVVEKFLQHPGISEIIIETRPYYIDFAKKLFKGFKKVKKIVPGADIRQMSVYNGLKMADEHDSFVLNSLCTRPFITDQIINSCIEGLEEYNAVATAISSSDTFYQVNDKSIIIDMPGRHEYFLARHRQGFKTSLIRKAHEEAIKKNDFNNTDDAGLFLKYSDNDIKVITGITNNIKITYPDDIKIATFIAKSLFKAI